MDISALVFFISAACEAFTKDRNVEDERADILLMHVIYRKV